MNLMGIGPQEMMIIAVIALLVFGPGKLPEVMGQAGKMVRDFRRMSAELSGEFEKTIAEARDATSGLTAELGGMSKEVNSITNSVKKDLGVKNTRTGASGTKSTGSKSSTSRSSTGSKTTGAKSSTSSSKSSTTSTNKTGSKASSTTSAKSGTTSTVTKKPVTPVATREDPTADVFLYEPKPIERSKRSRKAVPSIIADPTPRVSDIVSADVEEVVVVTSAPADDAIARARQRRRNAGYARASA